LNTSADLIALANLIASTITALCAIYIAFLALRHTAKPRIRVVLLNSEDEVLPCGKEVTFVYEVYNVGYWYGAAPAIDVTVYCNFDPAFQPIELRYGSVQEMSNTHVRIGKGGLKYIRATGLKLVRKREAERIHVVARTPVTPGAFKINAAAFSKDGASASSEFQIRCA
jgi:hypothetical protein